MLEVRSGQFLKKINRTHFAGANEQYPSSQLPSLLHSHLTLCRSLQRRGKLGSVCAQSLPRLDAESFSYCKMVFLWGTVLVVTLPDLGWNSLNNSFSKE